MKNVADVGALLEAPRLRSRPWEVIPAIAALAIAVVGVIGTWATGRSDFARVIDDWPAMVPETAGAIVCASLIIFGLTFSSHRLVTACLLCCGLVFVAAGSLKTYFTGLDDNDAMSVSTTVCLCLILIGAWLAAADARTPRYLAFASASVAAGISGFAVVSYGFDPDGLLAVRGFEKMSVNTAVSSFLLAGSVIVTARDLPILKGLLGRRRESKVIRAYVAISCLCVFAICKVIVTAVRSQALSPHLGVTLLVTLLVLAIVGGAFAMGYFVDRLELKRERLEALEQVSAEAEHKQEMADVRAQNMQVLGQIVAGVAHDFNNAMTALRGNLELIEMDPKSALEYVGAALSAADRASGMAKELVQSSKKTDSTATLQPLEPLVEEVVKLFRRVAPANIAIEVDRGESSLPHALIDPTSLERALMNLMINAQHAIGMGRTDGKITVKLNSMIRAEGEPLSYRFNDSSGTGEYVVVEVWDNGCGMDEETLKKAGKPYFTTKGEDEGSGLGLASAIGMCHQMGGGLAIESQLGIGTRIKMAFRTTILEPAEINLVVEQTAARAEADPYVMLLIEEPSVARSMIRRLESEGNRVEWHRSTEATYAALDGGAKPDALLIDTNTSDKSSGLKVAAGLRTRHPDLKVTLVGENRGRHLEFDPVPSAPRFSTIQTRH